MLTGSLNILRPAEEILHRKYTKNVDQKPPEGRSNRDVENQKPKSVFAFRHSVLLPIGKENDVENQNSFFSVRCIIPLFHPPIGVYTRYFLTLGAVMDFSRVQREKSIIARLEILSTWTITPLQFYTILICTNTAPHAPHR